MNTEIFSLVSERYGLVIDTFETFTCHPVKEIKRALEQEWYCMEGEDYDIPDPVIAPYNDDFAVITTVTAEHPKKGTQKFYLIHKSEL